MNDNFNDQKEKLVSLSHEINLLRQQVNFLLRNEKPLGLLDLDVLMNRTHTIYDTLCAINLGDNADEEDVDFDAEAFTNMLGTMIQTEEPDEVPTEMPQEEPTKEEPAAVEQEMAKDEPVEEPYIEPVEEQMVEDVKEEVEHPVKEHPAEEIPVEDEPIVEEEGQEKETSLGDEYGFLFRFEDVPPTERAESAVQETLGDRMMQEDHSLAAKLQQNPVRDLRSVIGINDKFLFVNELFGGSMEKYNKSIDNFNDLKTLNGAMIYLNELKIELQWNSSNEAYRKLSDLVARKFEQV